MHPHIQLNYLVLRGVCTLGRIALASNGSTRILSDADAAALPPLAEAPPVPHDFGEIALTYGLSHEDLYTLTQLSSNALRSGAQASTRTLYTPLIDGPELWQAKFGVHGISHDFDATDALLARPTHSTRQKVIHRRILLAVYTSLWSMARADPYKTVADLKLPVEDVKLIGTLPWPRIEQLTESGHAGISLSNARETIAILAQRTFVKADADVLPRVAALAASMLR